MNVEIDLSAKSANGLPALSEHSFFRYFNFIALYVAQGIPEGMTYYGIPAWMAMNGKSPAEIGGFVAVVGIPWSFKVLVAPLMDRFTYLPMGRRRPWVIFGQLGLMISFIGLASVPDPLNHLPLLMVAGFFVSFFGAFQDVATDGMAIDIVPIGQQARANGLMWGSKTIGISASLALGTWLINQYGFSIAILMLSLAVCIIMLVPIFLRERPGEKLLPWMAGAASTETKKLQLASWSIIFKSLYNVFRLRNSLLLAITLFFSGMAYQFMNTLIPVFTIQVIGWTDQAFSQVSASASLVGGLSGMIIGGILIDRFGKKRMLSMYYVLLMLLATSMSFLKMYWGNYLLTTSFIFIFNLLYVFATIGIFAVAMQCCWKKISATQFTLYMTVANMGYIVGPALLGPIRKYMSWEFTIFSFSLMIAVALIAIQLIQLNRHVKQVELLENRDHQKQTGSIEVQIY